MLKKILIGLVIVVVGAVAGLAAVIALQPSTYSISRSATMAAAPTDVFAQVNDFHNWKAWWPWGALDPAARTTFEGSASGKGAVFKWSGNDEIGEGSMTIVDSQPPKQIKIKVAFVRPSEETALVMAFDFAAAGSATTVTWTWTDENNFISMAMGLVMGGMDKVIGPDLERGLAQMKAVAEKKK